VQIPVPTEAPVAGAPPATGTAARDRVFRDVLAHGPVHAADVARRLGVTPAAVRRHLETLEEAQLVAVHDGAPVRPRGRGRPARSYVVTARGHRAAGAAYEDAALAALGHIATHYGPEAVVAFADERMAEWEDRWRDTVDAAGPHPADRARALAGALASDGFAAEARPLAGHSVVSPGVQICQGHCPVHALATVHPELCDAETRAFSRLVGAHVQRLATIAHGDHVCTTFVPATSPAPLPARPDDPRPEGEPHDHRS
jgi:predicted ArsR family transcriptional regulator